MNSPLITSSRNKKCMTMHISGDGIHIDPKEIEDAIGILAEKGYTPVYVREKILLDIAFVYIFGYKM